MTINFFYRSKDAGFSIARVFEPIAEELQKKGHIVNNIYVPSKYGNISDIIKNALYARRELKKNKNKEVINHITGDVYYLSWFLPKKNLVVTVHDIWFYTMNPKGLKMKMKYFFWIRPLKRAKKVTFISEASRTQVLQYLTLKQEQTEVIENPVSPDYISSDKPFNSQKPVILHLGMSPSKNLGNLIPALKGISCHLRLIGQLKPEYQKLLEENNIEYSFVYNLTNKEVVQEYAQCDIVNLTSEHEGFGMPIIEGQASNKIVVTSDISPMKEIAGDGACLVNPGNREEIHAAYKKIIEDEAYREDIRGKGLKNAKRFQINVIAAKYETLYSNMLNKI
ncbi:MAG: glycosyltransferase [Arachidicoccus sp.]|nr:glycosyltransferase [Arachidicoccus sp.]